MPFDWTNWNWGAPPPPPPAPSASSVAGSLDPRNWTLTPGNNGQGVLLWTGPGPGPFITLDQQSTIRRQLAMQPALEGAQPAEEGFFGSLDQAGAAFGSANEAFLQLLGLAQRQAALGQQLGSQLSATGTALGGEISDLSRMFLSESTPLRRGIIGATEAKLGVPLLADLPEGHKGGVLVDKKGRPTPLTPEAKQQQRIRGQAATGALFGPSAPERAALDQQFAAAREAAIASSPARGGQLAQQLTQLPEERARAIASMEAGATSKALGLGMDIGLGTRGLALQGLGAGAGGGGGGGFGGVGSGFTGMGSQFGSFFNEAANRAQQDMQFQLGLLAQQQQASQQAAGAKKGATGQGVGAGVGAIGGVAAAAII